ncbi:MAG: V-type ATPase 116kDa subunit family protein, partial [Ruthenibacterium sp.]
ANEECFHPESTSDAAMAAADTQENIYAPLLTQAIGLLKDLSGDAAFAPYTGRKCEFKDVKNIVDRYAAQVAQRRGRKTEIEARLATYEQTKMQLYHLTGLHSDVDEIFSCKYLKVRFGRLPKDSYFKLPYYADKAFTFNEYDFDGEYYWGMYFVPQDRADEVDDIFTSLYFERMWVPDFVHGTPQDALAVLLTQQNELEAERKQLDNMSDIANPAELETLRTMTAWLNYESQIFEMYRYVVILEHSYYISGYTPETEVARLNKALSAVHGVKVLEDEDADVQGTAEGAKPPVKLKNNWFARPFEMFVEMYGLPGYGEIDPTSFVAVTYAILFGAMFGDVGQGVVLGLVGYFVMYKMMHLDIGLVLSRCSIFSVLFGFIYGSVFGFEHLLDGVYHGALGISFLPIAVMEPNNISGILITSIGAGVFIITAAICTGILCNFRRHVYAKTIFSVNGLAGLVFYLSLIALLLKMALGIDLPFVGSTAFTVVCLVVPFLSIYFAEPICAKLSGEKLEESVGEILTNGFFDLFDALLSFASNTMSFLRVGGFVLAHAGMMSVVATLAGMSGSLAVQGVVYVLGNIFVMAMEGLFVAIQVLRLEFYEMFSRFFEASGAPYEPLKIRLTHDEG